MAVLVLITLLALISYSNADQTGVITAEDLARIRCNTNSHKESYTIFNGTIYSWVPAERQKTLFKFIGLNVARCFEKADGSYNLTSREVMFYLDPITGRVVDTWTNPWTLETVPVMHVANNPVQQRFANVPYPVDIAEKFSFLPLDIPLFYPNPLAGNSSYAPYSPDTMYQAGEFFRFIFKAEHLDDRGSSSIPSSVTWNRMSPWLPWMKQGSKAGQLVFAGQGSKLRSLGDVDQLVRDLLAFRAPLYLHSPNCVLDTASMTSWRYFAKYFNQYLAGATFPIYEDHETAPCAVN